MSPLLLAANTDAQGSSGDMSLSLLQVASSPSRETGLQYTMKPDGTASPSSHPGKYRTHHRPRSCHCQPSAAHFDCGCSCRQGMGVTGELQAACRAALRR